MFADSHLHRELTVARRLAREAGETILSHYRQGVAVDRKAADEPVTVADRAADALIRAGLAQAFPGDGLLTEESEDDRTRLDRERVWIVDPLDGTTEFIAETGEFVVQIALTVAGAPVLGVVYQPTTGREYLALKGQGAYHLFDGRQERLWVSDIDEVVRMRLVASRSHYSPFVQDARRELGIEAVTRMGSVGLKVGEIVRARCDLYVGTSAVKEWDLCAPHVVLLEAGGILTDLCGQTPVYNKPELAPCQGVIASNGRAHGVILDTLARFSSVDGR